MFPPKSKANVESKTLSYSSVYKIIQKVAEKTGCAASSRSLRYSKVSNSREVRDVEYHRALADSMSHSYETAQRSYNYQSISNRVQQTLSMEGSVYVPNALSRSLDEPSALNFTLNSTPSTSSEFLQPAISQPSTSLASAQCSSQMDMDATSAFDANIINASTPSKRKKGMYQIFSSGI